MSRQHARLLHHPRHAKLAFIALTLVIGIVLSGCNSGDKPLPPVDMQTPKFEPDFLRGETFSVLQGIHVLGEISPSAVYAIETGDGIILIDSGSEQDCRTLRESLLGLGLRIEDVKYVLLTHSHYDHVFGANRIRQVSGAQVCCGAGDVEPLKTLDTDAVFSLFPRIPFDDDSIDIDRALNDGDLVELGDSRIEVIAAPGHTPGSVCYEMHRDGKRVLFSGDVVSSRVYGPAVYPVRRSPRYRGDAQAFLDTIEKLQRRPPPEVLLPGHPRQESHRYPVLIPTQEWQQLLSIGHAQLQSAIERLKSDGADFLEDQPKWITPRLGYLGMLDGIGVYSIVSDQEWILINAPAGEDREDFSEFVQTRAGQLGITADRSPTAVLLTTLSNRCAGGLSSLPKLPTVFAGSESKPLNFLPENVRGAVAAKIDAVTAMNIETVQFTDHHGDQNVAYRFRLDGKLVYVTPSMPLDIAIVWMIPTGVTTPSATADAADLRSELLGDPQAIQTFRDAMAKIWEQPPDIWLPAVPKSGQNANVYDDRWSHVLYVNYRQAVAY